MQINHVYRLENGSFRIEYDDGVFAIVPDSMTNRNRQEIEEWTQSGGTIVEYKESITRDKVNAERDRRIAGGFRALGKTFDYDDVSRQRISAMASMAAIAIVKGAPEGFYRWHGGEQDFEWFCADNSAIKLDAQKMFYVGTMAMAHESEHIKSARRLKEEPNIPDNYTDDMYWPRSLRD